ncbi:MAG: hypothetical protein ACE5SW_13445 [Nitrososphaeraceae archaeon]
MYTSTSLEISSLLTSGSTSEASFRCSKIGKICGVKEGFYLLYSTTSHRLEFLISKFNNNLKFLIIKANYKLSVFPF